MNTLKNLYTALVFFIFAFMFWASSSSKQATTNTENTYEETKKKESEPYLLTYDLPVISPTSQTTQTQKKGGVTVTCEIVPFNIAVKDKAEREVYFADPTKPGYDIFQIKHTPIAEFYPQRFKLNIKIKNNQERILKVRETALLMQIDGITYNVPEESLKEWYAGMIIKDGIFNYEISGPAFNSLINAKLVYLFINDVPTVMDEGGNIKKRENFEWFFVCKKQTIEKQEQITYSYESSLIETKRCDKCNGTGTDPQAYRCKSCDGTGVHKNIFDGKYYNCADCSGTGIVHYKCSDCYGAGTLSFPKSRLPKTVSSITWTDRPINVTTNPAGAIVKVVDTKTKEYKSVGTSNCTVDWYTSSSASYPIIIEYQGKTVKVLPFDIKGKELSKVEVNFFGEVPLVTKGQKVN